MARLDHPTLAFRGWLAFGVWVLVVLMAMTWHAIAHGQGIESVMAPGPLIEGHAKFEGECASCHVKFDRKAQSGLCADCHKAVASDLQTSSGYHGRLKDQTCRSCHTDHKGRAARIVVLDEKRFDHSKTDYPLKGKHDGAACKGCHVAGKKHRDAPTECVACHRKEDPHKGRLGDKCADCHNERKWTDTRFDHADTKFALEGTHQDAKCTDCHRTQEYRDTPTQCIRCHRKADEGKGHKGQFGERCESCHAATGWSKTKFNHDVDTKYALQGLHRKVECGSCHTGHLYRVKLKQTCISCHADDDKHKKTLGDDCASCHTERGWTKQGKFDHALSSFPLFGKHAKVECADCHRNALFKDAPQDCFGCHEADDKHRRTLGTQCADCHRESDWKSTSGLFRHERTRFALRHGHATPPLQCSACHASWTQYRDTSMRCVSCHQKDDKHQRQLGTQCGDCHDEVRWKQARFDHGKSRFPLLGRHQDVACSKCHDSPRFKDAKTDCVSCHVKDDKHKQALGAQCQTCHNARAWSIWSFDHRKETRFALDGAHQSRACHQCHRLPAPVGKAVYPVQTTCVSCHRQDDLHFGQFGMNCERCHATDRWKNVKVRLERAADRVDPAKDKGPGAIGKESP